MTSLEKRQIELKVQQQIQQVEDELVTAIQWALDNTKYGDLEESQFRNLVRVAETTESPEVIKNFLRYQVGRDHKWGRGEGSFANQVITDVDHTLKEMAEKIANSTNSEEMKSIWLTLIRRYLGYGSRYLKYLRKD